MEETVYVILKRIQGWLGRGGSSSGGSSTRDVQEERTYIGMEDEMIYFRFRYNVTSRGTGNRFVLVQVEYFNVAALGGGLTGLLAAKAVYFRLALFLSFTSHVTTLSHLTFEQCTYSQSQTR